MIDSAKITVEGGKGGNGLVSFRREKYVPKGGPDGGDGGKGGNVIIRASLEVNTLRDINRKKYYKADNGGNGGRQKRTGAGGDDLIINLPVGTIVRSDDNTIGDLTAEKQEIVIARGGKGGRGNVHFANPTHQVPREAESGQPGDKLPIELELKLMADVGLVGLPNAGKSTLLSALTHAKPKIADYPFTTLEPLLGVADYKKRHFVIADIPGLIAGAAAGKGLGDRFLKHVERTKIIVHLITATSADPHKEYKTIRGELGAFNKDLLKKPEIITISQIDKLSGAKLSAEFRKGPLRRAIAISALKRKNLDKLQDKIISKL